MKRSRWGGIVAVLVSVVALACGQTLTRTVVTPDQLQTVDRKAPFLKAHMRDGALYVLSPWSVDDSARTVRGSGTRYDLARAATEQGQLTLPLDSVVLFETNVPRTPGSVAALAVVTGITAGFAIYCASNPKACFGSCPTFYVTDGGRDVLQAEGFSASVAPSLEARDVDALYRARPRGREVRIDMVNEAYETHVVRFANLLAAPRRPGRRVMADHVGRYWSVTDPLAPTGCRAADGDCSAALAAVDGKERLSAADSTDLGMREFIDLTFDTTLTSPALVLASRQSLLPTYLLYQAFAYLGNDVGRWLAAFERADSSAARRARGVVAALGGIDVLVPGTNGGWDSVATILETGPLAADVRLIPLPTLEKQRPVRLRMAKGAWRIDAAGLVSLGEQVTPIRIEPREVRAHGARGARANAARDDAARAALIDPTAALTTFPGDRYTLVYALPAAAERYELFLETKGYYLEWMRNEWTAEENPVAAASLFLDPAGALRRLAPAYKREEPKLEAAFWRSKYAGF